MIIFIEESNFKQRQPSLKDGILKGILWHQGEAGAHSENAIQVYEENMKTLFNKFRTVTGNAFCQYYFKTSSKKHCD